MKKNYSSTLLVIALLSVFIYACDSHSRVRAKFGSGHTSPAYGSANSNVKRSTTVFNTTNPSTPAKVAPNGYNNPSLTNTGINSNTQSVSDAPRKSSAQAGLLTGGETNDLSKWELWGDMVKASLEAQIKLWKMHPYQRYAVLLQTEDGMPVQGAKVTLMSKNKNEIWEAITDNTGTAQLWSGMFSDAKDTVVSEIKISYKKTNEVITNPVRFSKGINTKQLKVSYQKSNNVDIAFVVDATGSMQDEIDFLKEELNDIIGKTQSKYDKINLRLGSVFYRCKGNEYTTRTITLTNEHSAVMDFISAQNAGEGGTEAVEVAFEDALDKLKWREDARTRIMFFVLDEPSGYSDVVINKLHDNIQLAAKKGIKVIPIVASGSGTGLIQDRNLEFLMRTAAMATNGNYIFMTDHSGIGGKHTEPIIDNYEVELLNDIVTRTIHNNIFMPEKTKPEDLDTPKDTLLVDNAKEVVDDYVEELLKTEDDSTLLASLLTYTDYETVEELNKNKPVKELDSASLINDKNLEIHTLKIYPNPSNGMIKAEFNTEVDWLYLADLSGKILNRINVQGSSLVTVDLNEYPSGIYLVQYPDKDEETGVSTKWISAKIILQK